MTRASLLLPIALAVVACGRSRAPTGEGEPRAPAVIEPRKIATPTPTPTSAPSSGVGTDAAPTVPHDPPPSAPPAIGRRGDRCRADDGCGWDDPCRPTRCGAVAGPVAASCDKSTPPPGTCACVEGQCALRRTAADDSGPTGCASDADCAVDVGGATCALGGTTMIGPITEQGPVCTCAAGRCAWSWVGPVPCTTWRDCSWATAPRLRPVPSSAVPRPVARPVRACEDGERDSVCSPAHTCRIVGWSC